jgi:glycolate dehydrogenase FAD-linked subunit
MTGSPDLAPLRAAFGTRLVTEGPQLDARARDASIVTRPAAALLFAQSTADVATALRLADEMRLPIVPRGSGTSVTGSAVPPEGGGLVLDLSRMQRILEVDPDDLVAVVEPGVLTADLRRAAAAQRLFYPPDPASLETSSIGGNLATNAGGASGLKYGTTRDYVSALEVVVPGGAVLRTGARTVKNATGYALAQLFVGSEGTLGVITAATLRLLPLPTAERTVLAGFDAVEAAAAFVGRVLAAGLLPASLELMDRRAVEAASRIVPGALMGDAAPSAQDGDEAIVLCRLDGTELGATEAQEAVADMARTSGARLVHLPHDRAEEDRMWAARRAVTPALEQASPARLGEDVVVPRSRIVAMVGRIREIARQRRLTIVIFGHVGDGNLHPSILFDPVDRDQVSRMRAAASDLFTAALELGGLPSGEHGIGELKKDFLPLAVDPVALELMRSLKTLLDPHGILNPGKLFPDGRSPIQPQRR